MAAHDRSRKVLEDDEEDPVENMIKKTGCLELHYKVQVFVALYLRFYELAARKFFTLGNVVLNYQIIAHQA